MLEFSRAALLLRFVTVSHREAIFIVTQPNSLVTLWHFSWLTGKAGEKRGKGVRGGHEEGGRGGKGLASSLNAGMAWLGMAWHGSILSFCGGERRAGLHADHLGGQLGVEQIFKKNNLTFTLKCEKNV